MIILIQRILSVVWSLTLVAVIIIGCILMPVAAIMKGKFIVECKLIHAGRNVWIDLNKLSELSENSNIPSIFDMLHMSSEEDILWCCEDYWSSMTLMTSVRRVNYPEYSCQVWEAIYINKKKPSLNRAEGLELPSLYNALMDSSDWHHQGHRRSIILTTSQDFFWWGHVLHVENSRYVWIFT